MGGLTFHMTFPGLEACQVSSRAAPCLPSGLCPVCIVPAASLVFRLCFLAEVPNR